MWLNYLNKGRKKMTEYNEQVEKARERLEREQRWRQIKYIHANNGVVETKLRDGTSIREDTASGKVEVELGKLSYGEVMKVWKHG
jgi:hypothetical protein